MRTINFLLLAAFAAASANAAPAADEDAVSVTADLRGMNLKNEGDLRRLDRRVSQLATTVCVPPGNRSVGHVASFNACRAAAISGAKRQIEVAVAAAQKSGNTRLASAR